MRIVCMFKKHRRTLVFDPVEAEYRHGCTRCRRLLPDQMI